MDTTSGHLLGGADDIFVLTSNEEHAYNVRTQIWFLPLHGRSKLILDLPAVIKEFVLPGKASLPGVRLWKETYDGTNSATKGRELVFWAWNPARKTLTQSAAPSTGK